MLTPKYSRLYPAFFLNKYEYYVKNISTSFAGSLGRRRDPFLKTSMLLSENYNKEPALRHLHSKEETNCVRREPIILIFLSQRTTPSFLSAANEPPRPHTSS